MKLKRHMKNVNSGLAVTLRKSVDALLSDVRAANLTAQELKILNKEIATVSRELTLLHGELDPIKLPHDVFDPGNPKTIGFFVALALTAQPKIPLESISASYGSGVYAIYFNGKFPHYAPISGSETPIYVGQASPVKADARTPQEQGPKLTSRLLEHRKTITHAGSTLDTKDFQCRVLVVQSAWETAAEDYLIKLFKPVWNKETRIVQGFGKHGDDPTKRQNKVSSWDVLHQGRTGAGIGVNALQKSEEAIVSELQVHFSKSKIFRSFEEILEVFLADLKQS